MAPTRAMATAFRHSMAREVCRVSDGFFGRGAGCRTFDDRDVPVVVGLEREDFLLPVLNSIFLVDDE